MDMLQIVDKPCVTVASNRDVYLKYEHMGGKLSWVRSLQCSSES